jgi:hypothetical protein
MTYAANGDRDRLIGFLGTGLRKAPANEVLQSRSIRIGGCILGFAFQRWLWLDGRRGGSDDGCGGLREHRLRRWGRSVCLGGFLQHPDALHERL